MAINWFKYSSPASFYSLAGKMIPFFTVIAIILLAAGLYVGFFIAPTDFQQGEAYRIIFIHVPAAWMSMFLYVVMAFWAGIGLAFNTRLSAMFASAIAPTGAMFTFVALWTGSLWGKPMWGTWWVWDARLTSVFILFLMYLGVIALSRAIEDQGQAARAVAILVLVGFINIPVIKFSVDWWNTLHQPAAVMRLDGPTIHPSLLWPLLISAIGFSLLFFALHMAAMRNEILSRRVVAMRRIAARSGQAGA